MADEDKASKTEEPTAKRLSQARDEGNVANSKEITNVATLLGAGIFLLAILPWASGRIAEHMAVYLSRIHEYPLERGGMGIALTEIVWMLTPYMALTLTVFVVLAIISQVGQVGFLFTTKPLAPKMEKISPIKGFKRIFSAKQLLEVAKGFVKIGLIGVVAYFVLKPILEKPYTIIDQGIYASLHDLHDALVALVIAVLLFMIAIAFVDLVYTRMKHSADLRMTKQEVKDENKNMEGDPQVKSRIRGLRQERARQRMMQAVPGADVVVTNPTHYAVALTYDIETMTAPRLVAKGQDHLALRIREVAEENDVPIVENPPLARALHATVDLDQEIPPEHYQAVAEVIGYVMRLRKQTG